MDVELCTCGCRAIYMYQPTLKVIRGLITRCQGKQNAEIALWGCFPIASRGASVEVHRFAHLMRVGGGG